MSDRYYPLNRAVIKKIVSVYVDDAHEADELTEEILVRQVVVEPAPALDAAALDQMTDGNPYGH